MSLAFFLIWNPLGLESGELFAYMLACLLVIRLFDTFFELPSSALAPELSEDYNGRTTLIALRGCSACSADWA
uniref:MFS transporter n=1 Tax=Phenylobacterium glaciei TaxID=2803784 RepID=A0A974P3E8_9CAUL|nr:MFS transporter [Phenylobacterium glaciei]